MRSRRARRVAFRSVLRDKLTPSYRFGCKRVLISNDYYPALQRANVELVTDAITEGTPRGVPICAARQAHAVVSVRLQARADLERLLPGAAARERRARHRCDHGGHAAWRSDLCCATSSRRRIGSAASAC